MIPNLIILANFLIILVFSIADPSISDIFKVIGVIAIIISTYFAVNYKLKSVQKDVKDVKEDLCQLKNELEKKVDDLEKVVERLRMPQDYSVIIQRIQSENDWLKERLVNLEKEMISQSERAHNVISELTTQVSSEYRKLLESMIQMQGQIQNREGKGFWKR